MREHPILFSGPMVRAILDGRKTQTRRVVKEQPSASTIACNHAGERWYFTSGPATIKPGLSTNGVDPAGRRCPYGQPGDRLWVRETWRPGTDIFSREVFYRADGEWHEGAGWKPSIHMPRWASRLALEVMEVRVQRLQEISEEDARAEGIERSNDERWPWRNYDPLDGAPFVHSTTSFMSLWNSINGERPGCSWGANPWVWRVSFRQVP